MEDLPQGETNNSQKYASVSATSCMTVDFWLTTSPGGMPVWWGCLSLKGGLESISLTKVNGNWYKLFSINFGVNDITSKPRLRSGGGKKEGQKVIQPFGLCPHVKQELINYISNWGMSLMARNLNLCPKYTQKSRTTVQS